MALVCLIAALVPASGQRVERVTGMSLVLIPAGTFVMGTPATERQREDQERPHRVTLTRPFYLGRHEVTQREWRRVTGANPSHFAGCDRCPVERVSYLDIATFLERLNAATSWRGFRLPTEAEWEYACRAGGTHAYGASDALDRGRANYDGKKTTPVGGYPPNAWGLFDMPGNVWEWTSDDHCAYPAGSVMDPAARCASGLKVIRGGSWRFGADSARCGLRYTHRPQDRGFSLGVRLAHDAE